MIVNGTDGDDQITITQNGTGILVDGLPAQISISGFEAANDRLVIDGGTGEDSFVYGPGGPAASIVGFVAGGASNQDRINLKAFAAAGIHDLAAVLALATQVGADTVLDFGAGNTLTLDRDATSTPTISSSRGRWFLPSPLRTESPPDPGT